MPSIPARELRNDLGAVLRRVEAGEALQVTVSGRPVAELTPLPVRRRSISWETFIRDSADWRADPGLAKELSGLIPETTDDAPVA